MQLQASVDQACRRVPGGRQLGKVRGNPAHAGGDRALIDAQQPDPAAAGHQKRIQRGGRAVQGEHTISQLGQLLAAAGGQRQRLVDGRFQRGQRRRLQGRVYGGSHVRP